FFILLFILLFFMFFLIYREQDISNMHNLFGLTNQYENGDIYFPNPLSEEQQNQVIQKVEAITEEHDVIVIFTHYEGPAEKIVHFQYYVSGRDNFVQHMVPSSVNISTNFSKSSYYLTTDSKDPNQAVIPFFSFYQDAIYSIYSMPDLMDNSEAMRFGFTYFFKDKADRSSLENLFSSEF